MALETRREAENFLWSLCQGFDGDGWEYLSTADHTNIKLREIRYMLKYHAHSDTYDRHCNAQCRDLSTCYQTVRVDQRTCHHHNRRLIDRNS